MSQIELRPAEIQHAEKIAGLAPSPEDLRQAAPQELAPLNAHVVGQWIRERAAGYILTLDDEVVGYGELSIDGRDNRVFWIGHVMVLPRARNTGMGRTLVGSLARHAIEQHDARVVRISAFADNPAAIRCYRACGFDERGRTLVNGRRLIEMEKWSPTAQRVVSRGPLTLFVLAAAGLTLTVLPGGAASSLRRVEGIAPMVSLVVAIVLTTAVGVLLHPLIPYRAASTIERWLRPILYGAAVAGVTGLLASVGMFERVGATAIWDRPLLDVLSQSVLVGLVWGVALSLVVNLVRRRTA